MATSPLSGRALRALLMLAALVMGATVAGAQTAPAVEYQVKASLIFNFLHFVEWPPDASPGGELTICLFGNDHYGRALDVLKGEVVQGKRLNVRVSESWTADETNGCQVVVVSDPEAGAAQVPVRALEDKTVLTIGETPDFLRQGGIINFLRGDDSIQFELNLPAAKRARLTVSAKLLRLAKNVENDDVHDLRR